MLVLGIRLGDGGRQAVHEVGLDLRSERVVADGLERCRRPVAGFIWQDERHVGNEAAGRLENVRVLGGEHLDEPLPEREAARLRGAPARPGSVRLQKLADEFAADLPVAKSVEELDDRLQRLAVLEGGEERRDGAVEGIVAQRCRHHHLRNGAPSFQ